MMQRVARQTGLAKPLVVVGATDETWLQMLEWCQETIEDLTTRHDWRILWKTQTITGDGTTTVFALNSDFGRLSTMPAVSLDGSPSGFWPTGPVSNPGWISASTFNPATVRPVYKVEGTNISFYSAPATGETFTVSYQSKKPVNSASVYFETWQSDTDLVVIPERPVILGTVWRWKAAKGKAYQEALSSAERVFELLASHDTGLPVVALSESTFGEDEFGDVQVVV
jgi:hypothetical protein